MTARLKNDEELTLLEHLSLRPYYAVTVLTDVVQTIVKICAVAFSFLVAAIFFGQSSTMNHWCTTQAKDSWISFKMMAFSICGVISPHFALRKREILDKHGVNELAKFDWALVSRANVLESCGMRLQFLGNTVKEAACILFCGIRYFLSVTFELINFRRGTAFAKINLNELVIFSGHLAFTFGSCQGVFFPYRVTKMML